MYRKRSFSIIPGALGKEDQVIIGDEISLDDLSFSLQPEENEEKEAPKKTSKKSK